MQSGTLRVGTMQLLLLISLAVVGAVVGEEALFGDYHNDVGVHRAAEIKAAEEAADFDGTRITGGSAAWLGQFRHIGGLVITLTDGRTSVCGSSLLTNTRLLTAAHCWRTSGAQARQFVVVLGSLRLFSGGTRITTSNVAMHASYNMNTLANDIAMITTSWIGYSNIVGPVGLPTMLANENFAGWWAWAAGYGATGDNAPITNNQILSYVSLQVITNAVCAQTFGGNIIWSTLCTSGAGRSTCGGDSGGPLSVPWGGQDVLIGVVSFGSILGCQRGFPAGFARVTAFLPWIQARL